MRTVYHFKYWHHVRYCDYRGAHVSTRGLLRSRRRRGEEGTSDILNLNVRWRCREDEDVEKMSFLNLLLWSTDFLNVGLRNGNEVETENGRAWARFNGITTKNWGFFYSENLKINIDIYKKSYLTSKPPALYAIL